jgi:hypothetical protein
LTAGSDWLGKRVVRVFDGVRFIGQVISWVPANDDGDPPLWKIKHDDGDEEDLEECVIHPAPSRPMPCHVAPNPTAHQPSDARDTLLAGQALVSAAAAAI